MSKPLLMQHLLTDLPILLFGMAFRTADSHRATAEGGWRKGADWNCELAFFSLRNGQKSGADWNRELAFFNLRNGQKNWCGLEPRTGIF